MNAPAHRISHRGMRTAARIGTAALCTAIVLTVCGVISQILL